MKRTVPRRRTVPKVRRNADGQPRERFEHLRDDEYRDWIRARPCAVANPRCLYADHQSDAAHVESKARGAGDIGNLVPLCRRHHREQHDHGLRSFEAEHGMSLRNLAGELWLVYERSQGVEPVTGARTLEQVLADWRGEAAVLRRRGHDAQAATIEQLAADVAGAAEDYPRRIAPELHPTEKRLT